MNTIFDSLAIGKQAAENFVANNIPLNDSIIKLAYDNNLNSQQISRVIEAANTETYLALLKKAEDNYVEFPLAKINEVQSHMEKEAIYEQNKITDYDLPPAKESQLDYNIFSGEIIDMEKSAETKEISTEILKQAKKLSGTYDFLSNKSDEELINFESQYDTINNLVKQAVLSETSYSDVEKVLVSSMPTIGKAVSENIKKAYTEKMPHVDLTKTATKKFVNPDSTLYKNSEKLEESLHNLVKIAEAKEYYEQLYNDLKSSSETKIPNLVKRASVYSAPINITKLLKGVGKTALVAVPAGAAYSMGKQKGKRKVIEEIQKRQINKNLFKFRG